MSNREKWERKRGREKTREKKRERERELLKWQNYKAKESSKIVSFGGQQLVQLFPITPSVTTTLLHKDYI